MITRALQLAAVGLRGFPLRPRSKLPLAGSHGVDDATADAGALRTLFSSAPDDANLAVALGPLNGGTDAAFVLDVDPRSGGVEALAELVAAHGDLPATWQSASGRGDGGGHRFYRLPLGLPLRGKLAAGLDLKATGGYVVAPPSLHPATGYPYRWLVAPWEAPLADAPEWLLRLARREEAPPPVAPPTTGDGSIAYRRAAAYMRTVPPAISGSGGHSHTFVVAQRLLGFTLVGLSDGAARGLLDEWNRTCQPPWSKKELDHKWREARERGQLVAPPEDRPRHSPPASPLVPPPESSGYLPECPPDMLDEDDDRGVRVPLDPRKPDNIKDELAAQGPREQPWPDLEPFGSVTLPPFPVECLSPWLRHWAVAEAEFTQTPVDMAAMLALATAALVVSRGVDVMVKPGWVEPANIWVVVGAAPGTRKSPVFEAATRPVFEYQRLAAKQLEVPLANYLSDKKIIEGKVEAAERAAMKNKSFEGEDARDAAARLRSDLRNMKVVAAPNLLAADTTPEALTLLLSENGERVGIFSPEGGPIEAMAGRYSELPNLDIWLQGHDGGAYTVARVKRAAIFLARPLITIAIATQPAVIEGMGAEKLGRNKGLLARFLYCLPTSTVGNRKTDPDPVSELVSRAYSHAMSSMLVHVPERPRRLALSSSANDARATFQRGIERRIGPDGDLAYIADWAGKLVGLVARLACVLHCADNADRLHLPPTETEEDGYGMPTKIPLTTWLRAQQIGEFALEHAVHAFSCMEATEAETSARRLLKWIARRSLSTFAATDARRDLHMSAEVCDAALALLTTRGYVRRGPPAPPTGGRSASARFDVRHR